MWPVTCALWRVTCISYGSCVATYRSSMLVHLDVCQQEACCTRDSGNRNLLRSKLVSGKTHVWWSQAVNATIRTKDALLLILLAPRNRWLSCPSERARSSPPRHRLLDNQYRPRKEWEQARSQQCQMLLLFRRVLVVHHVQPRLCVENSAMSEHRVLN